MMRTFVLTALFAATAFTTPALAATFGLQSTDESSGTSWFVAPHISNGGYVWVPGGAPTWGHLEVRPLAFDHTLTFDLATDSFINVNLWQSETGITFENIFLNGQILASNFAPAVGGMPGSSIGSSYAAAGNVSLRFIGTNYGNPHAFGGTLNIDAAAPTVPGPIPEPSTWVFMIGGLALVGAVMRRRRKLVSFG